jgi:hypothetical protein
VLGKREAALQRRVGAMGIIGLSIEHQSIVKVVDGA